MNVGIFTMYDDDDDDNIIWFVLTVFLRDMKHLADKKNAFLKKERKGVFCKIKANIQVIPEFLKTHHNNNLFYKLTHLIIIYTT